MTTKKQHFPETTDELTGKCNTMHKAYACSSHAKLQYGHQILTLSPGAIANGETLGFSIEGTILSTSLIAHETNTSQFSEVSRRPILSFINVNHLIHAVCS